ncbi:MAG: hypothetical protein ACRDK4_03430 [Solirubrobacteraceae bacterium]
MRVTSKRVALAAVAAALTAMLLGAGPAWAAFTRPYLRSIPGTATRLFTGPFQSEPGPFGVAVDAQNNLWVSEYHANPSETALEPPFELDEFEYPSDAFARTLGIEGLNPPEGKLTAPARLIIDQANGDFYTDSEHAGGHLPYVEVFDNTGAYLTRFQPPSVGGGGGLKAIDDSTNPFDSSAGSLYAVVMVGSSVASARPAVMKLNADGEPVDFVNEFGQPTKLPYVEGSTIVGSPTNLSGCSEQTFPSNQPSAVPAITVDPQGDIYVMSQCREGGGSKGSADAVLEYRPSGEFVRSYFGEETPGIGNGKAAHENGGFGGGTGGPNAALAFDPVSDHLLVALYLENGFGEGEKYEGVIDEFDAATGKFVAQIADAGGGEALQRPSQVAVDSEGDVYVSEPGRHVVVAYGPGHYLASERLGEASGRTSSSAVLNGSVDPEGLGVSQCEFQYVPASVFDESGFSNVGAVREVPCVPAAGAIQPTSSYQSVHASAGSLASGATYRYRLLVTTEGALGGANASSSLAFTAPGVPRVQSQVAEGVSSSFVALRASIAPEGAQTSYQLEYVDEAGYAPGAEDPYASGGVVPVSAAGIGEGGPAGDAVATVVQHVGGLTPGTTYHFRVVAANEVGVTYGVDTTFATLPAPVSGLPDGRSYELVTPAQKGSAVDMFAERGNQSAKGLFEYENQDAVRPSDSGGRILLETMSAFGPFPASSHGAYLFERTGDGWGYTALASPSLGVQDVSGALYDKELSRFAFGDLLGDATAARFVALAGPAGGPYSVLNEGKTSDRGTVGAGLEEALPRAASADLGTVVIEGEATAQSAVQPMCPGAQTQDLKSKVLCEWSGGQMQLVNVNNQGGLLSRCGAVLGLDSHQPGGSHNAVSANGERVFFTAPDPYVRYNAYEAAATRGCWDKVANANTPQLYMRVGGRTVEISAPEAGVSEGGKTPVAQPAGYLGASEDGSKVFFKTSSELTKDDEGIHSEQLYEYDTETGALTRISAGESGRSAVAVLAAPAISGDGATVYFVADGSLTADAPALGEHQADLYRYDTNSAKTTFVATIYPESDLTASNPFTWFDQPGPQPQGDWYTTPGGRYLLFASTAEIGGVSTVGDCSAPAGEGSAGNRRDGTHCSVLYRYDAAGNTTICVSCVTPGLPKSSNALFGRSAGPLSGSAEPVRAMSDDGSYVFFDTAEALVPQDANGTLDVYEWHEGKLALVSSGSDLEPSFFLGMSANASNVFIGTHAKLLAQDTDRSGDVYDAHICSESEPCPKPPAGETAQCEGDACQIVPPAPIDQTPGSLTFSGAGNAAATGSGVTVKTKSVSRTARLSKALAACRRTHPRTGSSRRKRRRCEALARKRYGARTADSRVRRAKTSRKAVGR